MSQPYYPGQAQNQYGQNQQQYAYQQNPLFMGFMQNKELQQMGVNYLQSQFQQKLQQAPSLSDYIFNSTIRGYFNITNKYVLEKLRKIIFPFAKIKEVEQNSTPGYVETDYGMPAPTQEDHHEKRLLSPDLYIPLMSFMTFILMVCLARGIGKEFQPDLIGYYTTNCLFFAIVEMLLYKLILLIARVKTLSLLDLIAFLNYKFVGLCLILISSFLIGGWLTTIVKIYFSISFVYYMYVELRSHSQGISNEIDFGNATLKSDTVVYFLSGLQFVTMWLLVLTTTN